MYKKKAQGWIKHLDFMVLDLICLQISFLAAYFLRHGIVNPYDETLYRNMAIVMSLMDILVVIFFESLKNVLKRGYYKEFVMTVKHICILEVASTTYLFTIQAGDTYSRTVFFAMAVIYAILSYCVRLAWKEYLKTRVSVQKRSLIIVTTDDMVPTVLKNIKMKNYNIFHIAGLAIVNKDIVGQKICEVPVVAAKDTLADYVCRRWVDEAFINLPDTEPYPEEILNNLTEMGIVVHMTLTKSANVIGQKQFIERIGSYTVLTTSMNYANDLQIFLKRSMDILGGIVGCIITGILFLILAPAIYKQSPGPIFFSQIRVGRNGKQFKIYKFRSMYMDAEERKAELMKENKMKDSRMFKLDWDPRIIGAKKLEDGTIKKGIGNYIRDWSLDEFPQFVNVLKGDMSLIGTRPPTLDEWNKYELHHRARLAIKPGITGMWQVSGRSNITDFEKVVELDKKYIREWSIGLDIKILLKTILIVLKQDGAM